jgi:hypothetical protein
MGVIFSRLLNKIALKQSWMLILVGASAVYSNTTMLRSERGRAAARLSPLYSSHKPCVLSNFSTYYGKVVFFNSFVDKKISINSYI